MDRIYIDNLCNQKIVNETFFLVKEKLNSLKGGIEEIELLFKNCWYNFNRVKEMKKYIEGEIKLNPQIAQTLKNYKDVIPISNEILKFDNLTIWEDIVVFEFHAFLTNVIRTMNFWVKFNLTNKGGLSLKDNPTISEFVREEHRDKFYWEKTKEKYEEWISEVNKIRNDITNKAVEKRMQGSLIVTASWEGDNVDLIKDITINILDIKDLGTYCQDKLDKLKNFIEGYFKDFN